MPSSSRRPFEIGLFRPPPPGSPLLNSLCSNAPVAGGGRSSAPGSLPSFAVAQEERLARSTCLQPLAPVRAVAPRARTLSLDNRDFQSRAQAPRRWALAPRSSRPGLCRAAPRSCPRSAGPCGVSRRRALISPSFTKKFGSSGELPWVHPDCSR